jgi:uncharacterized protein YjbI with pentapeptide repeats
MKNLPRKLARIAAVATAETDSFVALARLAGLNPARAFRGANLRDVNFGTDDIAGFDFTGANLEGADLSRVTGHSAAILKGASSDSRTRWPRIVHHLTAIGITAGTSVGTPTLRLGPPPDFSLDEVRGCILHGEPVPDSWAPFVEELDLTFEASLDHGDFALPYQFQTSTIHPVNFTDLISIGRFSALRSLNIRGREVTDLGPLASLTALQSLDLGYNQVTDLTPLAALANLQSLNLQGTQIRNLSPLAGLPALNRLVIADTQVTDLSSLCGLSDDQAFFLFRTASIQGRLPNLEGNFTRADGSTATNNLQSLTELDISDTSISDLSPLLTLPSLAILDISRTKVETLRYLWGVKGLKKLILTGLPEGIESTLPRRAEIEVIRD